ncbi:MAG: pyridoxamine 5-phosphate oxidase, partial [Primorskyibacter sp.]
MPKDDPLQATDDDARDAARHLMRTASHASLGVLDDTGAPVVTRIAMAPGSDGLPLGLVSDLSLHTQ